MPAPRVAGYSRCSLHVIHRVHTHTQSEHVLAAGWQMQALYLDYDQAYQDEEVGDLPALPWSVTYPGYGSLAMLPLQGPEYKAQVCPSSCRSLGCELRAGRSCLLGLARIARPETGDVLP